VHRVANCETGEQISQTESALNVLPVLVLGGRRPGHRMAIATARAATADHANAGFLKRLQKCDQRMLV